MSVKDFRKIGMRMLSPYRLKRTELIDFLLDVKEKTKGVIELNEKDIYKLPKDDLFIEYDQLRNRVHSSTRLLFALFPTLEKKWLDKLSQPTLRGGK